MTCVLGNGQRQCWVHELTSLSIRALRVFHSKNSVVILYTTVSGGGGKDAAGYKPRDVCVSKLELTIVQGCTMVNGWHRIAQVKIRQADFNLSRRLHFR